MDKSQKTCYNCKETKSIELFPKSTGTYCNACMKEYLKEYRAPRKEFNSSILTDEDMKNEMKSIKKIDPKGLNSRSDLTLAFDRLCNEKFSFNKSINNRSAFIRSGNFKRAISDNLLSNQLY